MRATTKNRWPTVALFCFEMDSNGDEFKLYIKLYLSKIDFENRSYKYISTISCE